MVERMKINKILVIGIVITVLLIVSLSWFSLSRTARIVELGNLTFEELCKTNDDMWMVMEPWRKGKEIADQPCAGCMIADNHFCTTEEYIEYLKGLPNFGKNQDKTMEQMMMHEAMIAHGRYQNSVDVHMYNVEFLREKLRNSEIVFNIKEIESGSPVSDIEIVHDKITHIILVRSDLKYFDHIHPQQIAPGFFVVPYEFYAPGKYRIWIDFTIDGMQHIVDFDFDVPNKIEMAQPNRLSGLSVAISTDKLIVGKPAKIDFIVNDVDGKPVSITEKFLAANAHMIEIDESLEEFGHTHDEQFDNDNILSFYQEFQKSGMHKIWVQFSVNGIDRTAEFVVDVDRS